MLTQLRFKNWRSLKDVVIDDLQPINVFIGANSSGKTNILDGLYFLRNAIDHGIEDSLNKENEFRTIGVTKDEPIDISFAFLPNNLSPRLSYTLSKFSSNKEEIGISEWLTDETGITWMKSEKGHVEVKNNNNSNNTIELASDLALSALGRTNAYPQIQDTFQYVTRRWQMLTENFPPWFNLKHTSRASVDLIESDARNIPRILRTMRKYTPSVFTNLQENFYSLLDHVKTLDVNDYELETQILVYEKALGDIEAPTISAGTARLLAMFTAYYALDMRSKEMPGLIVIEEPDTALNPGLLGRFVSQLREYVDREYPRQFILTTHNPSFLDYFEPEEVRVVERDEQGYTHVKRIPEHVRGVWLDKYGLGEVWTTRSLGGVPE